MQSDWKHSGNWRENLKDQLTAVKEGLEGDLSEKINFVVKGIRITYICVKRLLMVANSYLDLVNDTILLIAILSALGNSFNPTQFASQVALILLVSLSLPLLLSAVTIAHQRPQVIMDSAAVCPWWMTCMNWHHHQRYSVSGRQHAMQNPQ